MSTTSGPTVPDKIGLSTLVSPRVILAVGSVMFLPLCGGPKAMWLRPCRKIVRCVKSRQTGVAAEQQQHVENSRRHGAAGQRGAQRLGKLAEPQLCSFGGLANRRFDALAGPVGETPEPLGHIQKEALGRIAQQLGGLLVHLQLIRQKEEDGALGDFAERLRARLERAHRAGEERAVRIVKRPSNQRFDARRYEAGEPR